MPPLKTQEEVKASIPQTHQEKDIFEPQITDKEVELEKAHTLDNQAQNLDLTIEPVQKPKRAYKKTSKYMSQKKKDQLARARKKASSYKRKQTIAKAQQYLADEKNNVDFSAPSVEPDKTKFNIDYERMSEMMMDKFESRMRMREEARLRARQELEAQERVKAEQEQQKRDWEHKIREDERKKIKGRFGQYTKQYRGQQSGNLNNLMRPRGNGGTYGNFW